jgi:hypothetical protein
LFLDVFGRNCSRAAALHSTSALGRSSPRLILASVIVDRTHTAYWSGMEDATTAISSLVFALDLMVHRVLIRMRKGARHGAVVQAHGRPELGIGWEHAHGSKAIVGSQEGYGGGSESDGRKKKGEWGQPRRGPPYL